MKGKNEKNQCGIKNRRYISKFMENENINGLDFKFICTNNGFSAAVTSNGKLYIWGNKYGSELIFTSPVLVNSIRSIIVDKIFLNYNELYFIARELDKKNGIFKTKLFILEISKNKEDPFKMKEINFYKAEEKYSNIIPIKLLNGNNKTYFLGIDENIFIDEILKNNEINNELKQKVKISFNLKNIDLLFYKHHQNLETMKKIYNSDDLNKFIDVFNKITDNNIKSLVKIFNGIKYESINKEHIYYNEFITYLKNINEENEEKELLSLFSNNKNNEGNILFNYFKKRIILNEQNFKRLVKLNISPKSHGFFQKIIDQNIIYLNNISRLNYFYHLLKSTINIHNEIFRDINLKKKIFVVIDRAAAKKFKEKNILDKDLTKTIFGQLFNVLHDLKAFRFLREKGEKLFEVKLKGELGIDQGGPYREILSDAINELQSDFIDLFITTPNNLYKVNPNLINNNFYNDAYEFIGKLMILAISTGETFNFNFHPIVWKTILENNISFKDYEEIDQYFYHTIKDLEVALINKDEKTIADNELTFEINLNGKKIELIKDGALIEVKLENVDKFINLAKSKILEELNNEVKYIKKGLFSVITKSELSILNWEQLEKLVCGDAKFDIKDFKNHTTYEQCYEDTKEIQWFWEWLESCEEKNKFNYLKFVSGRSRLPNINYEHSIILMKNDNHRLPTAHTCSSTLELSKYDSKELLFKEMNISINQKEMLIA